MLLKNSFFDRPAPVVAKDLLGKFLCRRIGSKQICGMITETEAYGGPIRDLASHASRGKTARNFPMFGPPGRWYIYFTYGMHWMANVVTKFDRHPSAVLIRGVEGINGPARVTKFFRIDKSFNNKPASRKTGLWIENRRLTMRDSRFKIHATPRVGVSYAGPYWSKRRWRFYIRP